MHSKTFKRSIVAAAIIAALAGGYAAFDGGSIEHAHALGAPATPAPPATPTAAAAPPDFSAIVERNGPAVVNISVTGAAKTALRQESPFPQLDPDDPFFEFFRRFQMPMPHSNVPVRSMGSGFIISPDGLVLTNAHVIDGADEVTVKLTDKRELKARVLGADKLTDVAVLRIDARNLPVVRLGDPARTRVGEWVLAIGSPFGLENSVGALVSTVEADSPAAKAGVEPGDIILKFNGTPINRSAELPPLVANLQPGTAATLQLWRKGQTKDVQLSLGELSAAKFASNSGADANAGRLGLALRPLTADERRQAEVTGGLLVEDVRGAAARAGIQPGDIVLALNGQAVTDVEQLRTLVSKVGKHAALLIERGNTKIFVPVELG